MRQRRRARADALERQAVGGVDAGHAQDDHTDTAAFAPTPRSCVPRRRGAARDRVCGRSAMMLVHHRAAAVAVHAAGTDVDQTLWYARAPSERADQMRGPRIPRPLARRRRKVQNVVREPCQTRERGRVIEIAWQLGRCHSRAATSRRSRGAGQRIQAVAPAQQPHHAQRHVATADDQESFASPSF